MKIDNFFAELKRRNVYKVAIAYIVAGWALSQGIAQVFPRVRRSQLGDPRDCSSHHPWLCPLPLVFAWFFEMHAGRNQTHGSCRRCAPAFTAAKLWIYVVVIGAIDIDRLVFVSVAIRLSTYDASSARAETAASPGQVNRGITIRKSERRQEHRLLQ